MFLHALLNGFAVAAAIVATLRAGSRALFISQNGAIGLVDGPTIAPPVHAPSVSRSERAPDKPDPDPDSSANNSAKNSSSSSRYNPALYEISENFKHCVRIASSSSSSSSSSSLPTGGGRYQNLAHDRWVVVPVDPATPATDRRDNNNNDGGGGGDRNSRDGAVAAKFRGVRERLAKVLEEDLKQRELKARIRQRKDPFATNTGNGEGGKSGSSGGYTLGYAPYEPKTFSASAAAPQPSELIVVTNNNNNDDDDDDTTSTDEEDNTVPAIETTSSSSPTDSSDESMTPSETETPGKAKDQRRTRTVSQTTTARAVAFWGKTRSSVSSGLGRLPSVRLPRPRWMPGRKKKNSDYYNHEEWEWEDETEEAASMWDYGKATEADWFYNVQTSSTSRRRRLGQLTAYCPRVFGHLRKSVFGIPEEKYLASILSSPLVSFQSNSKGAARAGGVFLFTSDGAYLIKTIPDREKKTFLAMLPKYHKHMKRYGKSSLLTRFCGMYGITIQEEEEDDHEGAGSGSVFGPTLPAGSPRDDSETDESPLESFAPPRKEYTFVVMNAVFPAESDKFISERFDLKGSTVGREVSTEELRKKGSMAVLKDLDLQREVELIRSKQRQQRLRMATAHAQNFNTPRWRRWTKDSHPPTGLEQDRTGFTIGATAKAALLSQLRKDVEFLTECQVMDYSLLVGVVHRDSLSGTDSSEDRLMTREMVNTLREQGRVLERLEAPPSNSNSNPAPSVAAAAVANQHRNLPKLDTNLVHTLSTPFRLLASPPVYVAKSSWNVLRRTLDSIVTAPLPYYGSGQCGVDGGILSVLHGERNGDRAIYYLGLIDFLQPWTTRKVLERTVKGMMGHDKDAISAVTPEEYAARFLRFLDEHIH